MKIRYKLLTATLLVFTANMRPMPLVMPVTNVNFMTMTPGDTMLAFPGAVGHGAHALDICRKNVKSATWPLNIWKITTVNGDGSLDAILEDSVSDTTYDIIIPTTGIKTSFLVHTSDKDCVYIAGQAGQGGGLTIEGKIENRAISNLGTNDIVWRGFRVRHLGNSPVISQGGERIIFDHISSAFCCDGCGANAIHLAGDTTVGATGGESGTKYFTISHSLMGETDATHATHMHIGGAPRNERPVRFGTVYRNFFSGAGHRIPNIGGEKHTVINNIMYNWCARGVESNHQFEIDMLNNWLEDGPCTDGSGDKSFPFIIRGQCGSIAVEGGGDGICKRRWTLAGNLTFKDNFNGTSNPWSGAQQQAICVRGVLSGTDFDGVDCPDPSGIVPTEWRDTDTLATATFDAALIPFPAMTSTLADLVADSAGASWGVNCFGTRSFSPNGILRRDTVDIRYHDQFEARNGPSSPIVGAATIAPTTPVAGVACADSDSDGLPDDYENICTASTTAMNPDDVNYNNYLAMEGWVNGDNTIRTVTWDDNSTNEDGFDIYRDVGAGFVFIGSVGANTTEFTDDSSDIGYRYKVVATLGVTDSPDSNIITSAC